VEGAFVGGAIAKEAETDTIKTLHLDAEADTGRNGNAAADHAVGSKVTGGHVGDVHRTAASAAVTGLLAKQLGHHQLEVCPFADAMTVTTVGAGDIVIGPQGL
jgi:hypothetical protein